MKRRIYALFAAAAVLASCSPSNEYVIYGTVTNPDLEGAQVFLVPLENAVKETIDSVYIKNQMFEFRGSEEKMADIRIERFKRLGNENLLVITEPGETYVTIGPVSSSRGTPQNDSLQVWKNLTKQYHQKLLPRDAYIGRIHQMADALGAESTLGSFLLKRFPKVTTE